MRLRTLGILAIGMVWGGTVTAAPVTVTRSDKDGPDVRILAPDGRFMEDISRYRQDRRADKTMPKLVPVTRDSYLAFIPKKNNTYGPEAIRTGPDRVQYGVRHAFPALCHYHATGDKELAKGIKKTLRFYEKKLRQWVRERKWHSNYMHDPTLLCMYRKVFKEKNNWTAEDERWFKKLFVWLCRTVHVWGTPPDFWRGGMHRATGEGIMKMLAVTMYPDIPEAAEWKRYAQLQWNDWWAFRDNPINDINYYHGQVFPMALGAHLLGRKEVFADPGMRKFWDRLIHMTTPDGAVVPFGPSWGWNSHAGERLMSLEIAATHTGDGRYRFVAHRIFNYLLFQAGANKQCHMLDHFSQLGVAVAYFIADDKIKPVAPEPDSVVLHHAETLRVKGKEGGKHYIVDMDPDPLKGHVDCALLCTKKVLPFKLCLRSGWKPGDLYMLVDLFPRHEPMNVGGVLGMSRYCSALTHSINSKGVTDWLNMLKVEDLSGTASTVINTNPHTRDAYYMDVTVPTFDDRKAATCAVVRVADYNGFPMTLEREFFFVKNRFCLIRDTAVFREAFLARIGPNWHTQNVGPQIGSHWANTYFASPFSFRVRMAQLPMDLLVYHAPHVDRRLTIVDESADVRRLDTPLTLRYAWEGVVKPGTPYTFTHLLLPGIPSRKAVLSNVPGAVSRKDILGQYMAAGVTVLKDDAEQSVWRIRSDKDRQEWVVLNPSGKPIDVEGLKTDARRAYVELKGGKPSRILALGATHLTLAGKQLFRKPKRGDFEK